MIDLHSHTTESDGTYSPSDLISAAVEARLEALAITDHDTLTGYEQALPYANDAGLTLVCGIEVSTALGNPRRRTVHLLGYFPSAPAQEFREWILKMQAARRDRNKRLAVRLQSLGIDIHLEEVEALGRSLAGRPHFARLMLQKGYVANMQEAFDRYLDESAPGYVEREEPSLEEGIRRVNEAGGVSSLAHPIRLGKRDPEDEEELIAEIAGMGL
ncbi:MAG: PHP domain-containing protein, partial [Bryobacteraceae bacterium]